jgi:hypothetical protein
VIVKEFFDVIIVGTSLAPLTAGALLSRRGLRVLVVGNGELEDEAGSLLLNTLTSDLVMRIFEELGVTHMVKRKVRRPEPYFQVILPGARIDVHPDDDIFDGELEREFPHMAEEAKLTHAMLPEMMDAMEKIIHGENLLPPQGLIERKKMDLLLSKTIFRDRGDAIDMVSRVLADDRFACFIRAVAASHSNLDLKDLVPAMFFFLHRRKVRHCAVFEGGLKVLKKILYDKIDAYGGEVRSAETIETVSLQGSRVAAVRLAGRETMIGCDFLLSGISSECLGAMLTVEGRSVNRDLLRSGDLVTTGYLVTTQLVVSGEAVPEAMASNIIVVFDCKKPLREANYLWAEIDEPPARGRRARRRISLHYILDRAGIMADPSYSKRMMDEILERFASVMPFLDRFIIDCQDPVSAIMKSHFTEDPMLHIARLIPSILEYRRATRSPFVGLGYKTGLRNVYRVNTEVCPSLGEDGLWLAGLGAARIVSSQRKAKTRLRRRIMFS